MPSLHAETGRRSGVNRRPANPGTATGAGSAPGRVVHVAVSPESEVEVEPQALPRADAFKEIFDVALHRFGQSFPAAHFPEVLHRLIPLAIGATRFREAGC